MTLDQFSFMIAIVALIVAVSTPFVLRRYTARLKRLSAAEIRTQLVQEVALAAIDDDWLPGPGQGNNLFLFRGRYRTRDGKCEWEIPEGAAMVFWCGSIEQGIVGHGHLSFSWSSTEDGALLQHTAEVLEDELAGDFKWVSQCEPAANPLFFVKGSTS